jgi:uncharacterized protein (TIGR03067 family)
MFATLVLAVAIAAPGVKDAPKKEAPSPVGEWVTETAVAGGMEKKVRAGSGLVLTAGGRMEMTEGGINQKLEGTFTIDARKSPATLDFAADGTVGKGLTIAGIYKVEGDTLTVCLAIGDTRPEKFESPAGARVMLMTLKRAKPKE